MIERIPARVVDVGLAVLVALLAGGAAFAGDRQPLVVATTVAGSLLLVLRRSHPLLVLALVTAGTLALGFADRALLVASLAVALYSCGAYVPRARSLPAALGALAVTAVAFVVNQTGGAGSSLPMLALLAAAWVFGDNARERSERNEQRARDAVAQERARIARELHDVVSHNVSVMVVQAAAGNDVFAERPERAREALVAIEETGRRSLAELRRLLDVVDGADGDGTAPQPGLARLDELVERVRAAGSRSASQSRARRASCRPGVDVSAYRIVQEALTNTLKHARATSADVLVRYRADALELVVSDDGVGGVAGPDGRGLVGMRERVALFGGELRAGAEPGGGFAVRARMPVGTA